MFKISIEKQRQAELDLCERQLLEAEGVLERATANRDMLIKRRDRLAATIREVQREE